MACRRLLESAARHLSLTRAAEELHGVVGCVWVTDRPSGGEVVDPDHEAIFRQSWRQVVQRGHEREVEAHRGDVVENHPVGRVEVRS